MWSKIAVNSILIIGLLVFQLAFISGLPLYFNNLNMILVSLILILGLASFRLALWWAISLGVLLDIYSFSPFGIYLVSLLAIIIFLNFLQSNFITNRSLYSFLALTVFAFLGYELLIFGFNYIFSFFLKSNFSLNFNSNFWMTEFSKLVLNLLSIMIVFYLYSFVSDKLRPVFIMKRSKLN